jgi:hypothetical protein
MHPSGDVPSILLVARLEWSPKLVSTWHKRVVVGPVVVNGGCEGIG